MAFDLFFAGEGDKEVVDFKFEHNVNQLLSQLNERKGIFKWIENMKNTNSNCKLFIDSGAWSAHSKGKVVDVDDYIKFINDYDEYFYVYAQLDKIPGEFRKPKTLEQKLEAPKISWDNYLYMKDRVKNRDKLLPIFHMGEDYKWLENMLEYTHEDTGKHIPYIGISPANDSHVSEKVVFIEKCFDIIKKSSNPNVKTHAFGMTSLDVLEQFPFTSADSTGYLQAAIYGGLMTPYGTVNISNRRLLKDNALFSKDMTLLNQLLDKYGFTLEELSESIEKRTLFNMKYLLEWSENYEYKPSKIKKNQLF